MYFRPGFKKIPAHTSQQVTILENADFLSVSGVFEIILSILRLMGLSFFSNRMLLSNLKV